MVETLTKKIGWSELACPRIPPRLVRKKLACPRIPPRLVGIGLPTNSTKTGPKLACLRIPPRLVEIGLPTKSTNTGPKKIGLPTNSTKNWSIGLPTNLPRTGRNWLAHEFTKNWSKLACPRVPPRLVRKKLACPRIYRELVQIGLPTNLPRTARNWLAHEFTKNWSKLACPRIYQELVGIGLPTNLSRTGRNWLAHEFHQDWSEKNGFAYEFTKNWSKLACPRIYQELVGIGLPTNLPRTGRNWLAHEFTKNWSEKNWLAHEFTKNWSKLACPRIYQELVDQFLVNSWASQFSACPRIYQELVEIGLPTNLPRTGRNWLAHEFTKNWSELACPRIYQELVEIGLPTNLPRTGPKKIGLPTNLPRTGRNWLAHEFTNRPVLGKFVGKPIFGLGFRV